MRKPWCDGLTLRPLAEHDLAPVAAIEAREPSPWHLAMVAAELRQANSIPLVAELHGVVVGWCCSRFCATEADLLKIAVAPSSRRAGVATRLLLFTESELAVCGVTALFLEVRARNRDAVAFYRATGFTEVGRRIRYYQQPADDALVFRKAIQSGNPEQRRGNYAKCP